ncbi:MAG: class I SAM-dependent methyltransferase [Desulfobulbaceae bacterium]|nr:class I SAM-dependent methyltransferase [Desulfobulbaceae bacterium]
MITDEGDTMSTKSDIPPPPGEKISTGIYSFMDTVAGEAEEYAANHTSPMSSLLEEIERFTLNNTPYPSMLTGRVQGRFLQLVVQLSGARDIVDVGTFTGYSALAMAEALPPGGRILTIEHNPEHAGIAQDFFDRSAGRDKITLCRGEALEILKTLPDGQTDLVFIDADKQNYIAYYEESMRIVRDGGLILADNALWYGRIFDPQDDESRAIADFNERVNTDDRSEKLFLTIRDGIYLIRKTAVPDK